MISTLLANYDIRETINYIGDNESFNKLLHNQKSNSKHFEINKHKFRIIELDVSNAFEDKRKENTSFNLQVIYNQEVIHERNMSTHGTKLSETEIETYLTLIGNNYSKIIQTAIYFNII